MRPSEILRGGGGAPVGKYGKFLGGEFGAFGSQTQKGIAAYTLSANRQRPFAGALHAAIFNTWRRTKGQILYVLPPFVIAYSIMQWAIERNHYLNSKAGRIEFAGEGGAEE